MSTRPPSMATWKFVLFTTLLLAMVFGLASLAVTKWDLFREMPSSPRPITLLELANGTRSPWMELQDAIPLCAFSERGDNAEVVAVGTAAGDVVAAMELQPREFCATLTPPLRVIPRRIHEGSLRFLARNVLEQVKKDSDGDDRITFITQIFLESAPDARQDALMDALIPMGLTLLVLLGQLWLFLAWRKGRQGTTHGSSSGRHSPTGVPAAGEVLASLAHGVDVDPAEPVLRAPLGLTAEAVRQAALARNVGAPLLVLIGVVAVLGSLWSGANIVLDVWGWDRSVAVPAEAKGKVTRYQGVLVGADVDVAYVLPRPDGSIPEPDDPDRRIGQVGVKFHSWFVGPGTDIGEVRVVPSSPHRPIVENAVDIWPYRALNVGILILIGVMLAFAARSTRQNAQRLSNIAADPEEVRLHNVSVTEIRVNGVRSGWTVNGLVDGTPAKFSLPAKQPVEECVWADDQGSLLVMRARGKPSVSTLVRRDLHPFRVSNDERVRAQAVLAARQSPTQLEK